MGYYVSHMFGIRTGGVFSGDTDLDDLKARIAKIVASMKEDDQDVGVGEDPSHCTSKELIATKGSYVVLAGVFNYWMIPKAQEFARRLSEEFGVEVMHMGWDEQRDNVACQIFLGGSPLFDIPEDPIGKIIRRVQ